MFQGLITTCTSYTNSLLSTGAKLLLLRVTKIHHHPMDDSYLVINLMIANCKTYKYHHSMDQGLIATFKHYKNSSLSNGSRSVCYFQELKISSNICSNSGPHKARFLALS